MRREREREREGEGRRGGKVTEAMDCFSAGCVLAELFLDGVPLFSLSQLFEYRAGRLDVDAKLSAIDDSGVRVSPTSDSSPYVWPLTNSESSH